MSKFANEMLYCPGMYDEEELELYIKKSLSDYENEENEYYKTHQREYRVKQRKEPYNLSDSFDGFILREPSYEYEAIVPDELANYISKMKQSSLSFQDQLKEYIRIKNLKDPDIYNPLGMPEKAFNKIKNQAPDKSISFDMAVMISYGLHLKVDEMINMLSLAGKGLKKNDKRHIIVRYFFEIENYNLHALNAALYVNKEKPFLIPKEEKETDCGIEM